MVSTHTNLSRSFRRPKSKIRMKRTKRRVIGRRIGTATSDSKSSLDNLEVVPPPPSTHQHRHDVRNPVEQDPTLKKRSQSEERPPSRIKVGQRSSSLQLDSVTQTLRSSLSSSANPVASLQPKPSAAVPIKKKSWFFAWPIRGLVVPNRVVNEDEGFDSFHGNNSSSSDCETEDKITSERIQKDPPSQPTATGNCSQLKESCHDPELQALEIHHVQSVSSEFETPHEPLDLDLVNRTQQIQGNLNELFYWLLVLML